MADDKYVRVDGTIKRLTERAVLLDDKWIPRSCIHGVDEEELEKWNGHNVTIRIFEWLAEKEGLI